MNYLSKYLENSLIGILLSDGRLKRASKTSNVKLNINMSFNNYPYIFHLYNLFESYIGTNLKSMNIYNLDKIYFTIRFKTISLPQLLSYYNIFYNKNVIDNKIKKRVPKKICNKFNEVSVAHLIIGNGNYMKDRNLIKIYTNSFIKEDVLFLSIVINKLLNINSKIIHDWNDQYIIIIEKEENVDIVRENTLPYIHPSMLYKLGI